MRNITETLMKPLEKFRKEQLGAAKVQAEIFYHFSCLHWVSCLKVKIKSEQIFCKLKIASSFIFKNSKFLLFTEIFFSHCSQAERKRYEKETEKYYSSLEKLLNMSAKKKEPQLQEVHVFFYLHTNVS